ncbi:interferon alpha-inducible protein 27-like protein 2A [Convolutriloba macropyga]|uniref:interferon alpha-inducible protein 27-like protein 2A n=1 Tax=Convolutriloba macropyga TaxID=536237 RepID=UPI003F5239EB
MSMCTALDIVKCVAFDKYVCGTAIGAGVALVGAPLLLSGIGFTAAGVAAGSIAASVQTPTVAAGSYFALMQSAGVLGMSAATKGVIGAAGASVGGAAAAVTNLFR